MSAPPAILSIGLAVPEHRASQQTVARWAKRVATAQVDDATGGCDRAIDRVYGKSAIDFRQSVVPDYALEPDGFALFPSNWSLSPEPGTGFRMALYREHAPRLAASAAVECLTRANLRDRSRITHVIVVSCTGFFAPGLDMVLTSMLGLRDDVQRLVIGFMGCHGGLAGLRAAQGICRADPEALVLVVCVELCTLHFQRETSMANIVANSLFSDGASAALVGPSDVVDGRLALDVLGATCALAPDTHGQMRWTIGDTGFQMMVGPEVPATLGDKVGGFLDALLDRAGLSRDALAYWAVHPGGRRILEAVDQALGIGQRQMEPSFSILSEYGNMSSASILFVIDRVLRSAPPRSGETGVALAFGPGLSMEGIALRARAA